MGLALIHSSEQVKFTYDDYLQLPDDGKRYEIIDGELYMANAPTTNHQRIVRNFTFVLSLYLESHPVGEILPSPYEVFFSKTNLAQPDIIFVGKDRSDIVLSTQVKGAPDLVIEVLSPGTEKPDRTIKLKMYAKFGVKEYWMVKEKNTTLEILRLRDGKLVPVAQLGKSDVLTSPLLPGLAIPLSKIFNF